MQWRRYASLYGRQFCAGENTRVPSSIRIVLISFLQKYKVRRVESMTVWAALRYTHAHTRHWFTDGVHFRGTGSNSLLANLCHLIPNLWHPLPSDFKTKTTSPICFWSPWPEFVTSPAKTFLTVHFYLNGWMHEKWIKRGGTGQQAVEN